MHTGSRQDRQVIGTMYFSNRPTTSRQCGTLRALSTLLSSSGNDANQLVSLAERAVKAKPDNAGYLETLGAAHYRAGNFQAAVKTLDEAVTKQGKGTMMLFFLAMAHHQLKNEAKAKEHLTKAIQQ